MNAQKKGFLHAIAAYFLWGTLPLYWKALTGVPALEIIAHRIVWSTIPLLLIVFFVLPRFRKEPPVRVTKRMWGLLLTSALLIGANWLTYIWSVTHHHALETSLGYFLNPLVNIILGSLFLKERLRRLQWIAVGIAASGVTFLLFRQDAYLWIAGVLALTFALYGLTKKKTHLDPLRSLGYETALLSGPSLAYMIYLQTQAQSHFFSSGPTFILLLGAGVATALPLLFFVAAARTVPLYLLGFLQYLAPTIQFVIAVWIFREPFVREQLIAFGAIWIALALVSFDALAVYTKRYRANHT